MTYEEIGKRIGALVDDLYENNKSIEIVGNKYDNPELLGGGTE